MDNTKRFDGKGELYAKARPKYAEALFEYMQTVFGVEKGSVFADVGSGTGIFTEQLMMHGYKVYAVEPNDSMRIQAERMLSSYEGFKSVKGTDACTGLQEHSVDYITAAQAFHWFDAEAFRNECERILKPKGIVFIVYNSRDVDAECTKALFEIRKKYNPNFSNFSNGISDAACKAFFNGKCNVFKCDNSMSYDRDGYINRVLSSSYSLSEDDPLYFDYINSINALFDKFSVDGIISVPTNTVAYAGRIESLK